MQVKTLSQFILTYEVPEDQLLRYTDMLNNGEDICEYEINQEHLGEILIDGGT